MQKQLDKFPSSKEVKVSIEARNGIPYEEIIKLQEEKGADLIVISPHGRSAIKAFFMGNVASRVLKHAKGEVLWLSEKQGYFRRRLPGRTGGISW